MKFPNYSPEIKRFISEDTFEGKYDELLNINLFEYANNNPVMNVDPEGGKDLRLFKLCDDQLQIKKH